MPCTDRGLAKYVPEKKATDENIYQLTRAILGAEMRNIVFGQYVEALTGKSLIPKRSSKYYDDEDPGVSNEFSTAAFRFGHSMIQGIINMRSRLDSQPDPDDYRIRDNFKDPTSFIYRNNFKDMVYSFWQQPSQV